MSLRLNCSGCGAEVKFKSKASVLSVCSFCRSILVRHDFELENLGKMAQLLEDSSPLQIYTKGQFEGISFEIIGRRRVGWSEGFWNEWYLQFANGKDGWLSDAQGFYAVSFQNFTQERLPNKDKLVVGDSILIDDETFTVDDIRQVNCAGSEGELPTKSLAGLTALSVDLTSEDSGFANIEYSEAGVAFFVGKYSDFDSFKFVNLRVIDGW